MEVTILPAVAAPQGTRGLSEWHLVPETQIPSVSSLEVAIARGRASDPLGMEG